jgi:hypothetical protein
MGWMSFAGVEGYEGLHTDGSGNTFSNVLYTVTVCSKSIRALTFENSCLL